MRILASSASHDVYCRASKILLTDSSASEAEQLLSTESDTSARSNVRCTRFTMLATLIAPDYASYMPHARPRVKKAVSRIRSSSVRKSSSRVSKTSASGRKCVVVPVSSVGSPRVTGP